MIHLALTLALLGQLDAGLTLDAGSPDAGSLDAGSAPVVILDVVEGTLVVREPQRDGGYSLVPRVVGDGCYEPTESCMRIGKAAARDTAEVNSWNSVEPKWIGVAFAGGAVVGLAVGIAFGLTAHPPGAK